MSDPNPPPPPSGSLRRTSASSAWSGRSIAELSGQDLVDAVTASIRDTPNRLEQIFGQVPGTSHQPQVQSTRSPGETTVIDQRIPGAWQQARPATPGNRYYPQLPALPNLLPSDAEAVLTERHYAPLPRSTFRQPIFPPPAPPPPPPPPPSFASPISLQEAESSLNIVVPPSPPSPNQPPPASFVMDPPPHLSATQRAADLAEAKAQLEESKIVGQAIHAATSNIPAENILTADGSNFETWTRELSEKAAIHLNDKDFFTKIKTNSVLEKIGRAILLAMVHESLKSDMHGAASCHVMFDTMFKKFKPVSRAAQLDVFYRFIEFKNLANPTAAGVASKLKDLATEWKNLKVELTVDTFMGFILQSSIGRDTSLGMDFDRRVELELQQSDDSVTPTFDRLVQLLTACKLQEDHTRPAGKSSLAPTLSQAIHQLTSDLQPFDQAAFLADIPEIEWPAALEFYHVTANRCWSCGDASHYLRDCPTRSRSTPVNRRQRGPGALSYRPSQVPRQQPHQAPFLPMIGAVYPPPMFPYGQSPYSSPAGFHSRQHFNPGQFFQQYPAPYPPAFSQPQTHSPHHLAQPPRPADSYRPAHTQPQRQQQGQSRSRPDNQRGGGASAKEAEISGLPDGVADVDFGAMTAELDEQDPSYRELESYASEGPETLP